MRMRWSATIYLLVFLGTQTSIRCFRMFSGRNNQRRGQAGQGARLAMFAMTEVRRGLFCVSIGDGICLKMADTKSVETRTASKPDSTLEYDPLSLSLPPTDLSLPGAVFDWRSGGFVG